MVLVIKIGLINLIAHTGLDRDMPVDAELVLAVAGVGPRGSVQAGIAGALLEDKRMAQVEVSQRIARKVAGKREGAVGTVDVEEVDAVTSRFATELEGVPAARPGKVGRDWVHALCGRCQGS